MFAKKGSLPSRSQVGRDAAVRYLDSLNNNPANNRPVPVIGGKNPSVNAVLNRIAFVPPHPQRVTKSSRLDIPIGVL
jgi:hypothetical protein